MKSNCYHREGHNATCSYGDNNNYFMLLFGLIQIFMSQIPNFHNMLWLSLVAAIMSFAYSFIGIGLSLGKIIGTYNFILLDYFVFVLLLIESNSLIII